MRRDVRISEGDGGNGGKCYKCEEQGEFVDAPWTFDGSEDGNAVQLDFSAILIAGIDRNTGAGHRSQATLRELTEEISAGSGRGAGSDLSVGFEQPCVRRARKLPASRGGHPRDSRLDMANAEDVSGDMRVAGEGAHPGVVAQDDGGQAVCVMGAIS